MTHSPLLPPSQLTESQKKVYDWVNNEFGQFFGNAFTWKNEYGAVVGLFAPLVYLPPPIALTLLEHAAALTRDTVLPRPERQIAILTAATHFQGGFILYAHSRGSRRVPGLPEDEINAVLAGKKPQGETFGLVWELATALINGKGPLNDGLWNRVVAALGVDAARVLVQFIGYYSYASIIVNGADAPVPKD